MEDTHAPTERETAATALEQAKAANRVKANGANALRPARVQPAQDTALERAKAANKAATDAPNALRPAK